MFFGWSVDSVTLLIVDLVGVLFSLMVVSLPVLFSLMFDSVGELFDLTVVLVVVLFTLMVDSSFTLLSLIATRLSCKSSLSFITYDKTM